jgi:hypothetical protein
MPAEHEKSGNGAGMKKDQPAGSGPVHSLPMEFDDLSRRVT